MSRRTASKIVRGVRYERVCDVKGVTFRSCTQPVPDGKNHRKYYHFTKGWRSVRA